MIFSQKITKTKDELLLFKKSQQVLIVVLEHIL